MACVEVQVVVVLVGGIFVDVVLEGVACLFVLDVHFFFEFVVGVDVVVVVDVVVFIE